MDIWDIEIITHVAAGGSGRGERDPRLQEAADSRATARYRVGVFLSRAYILPALTHTRSYVRTRVYKLI